MNNKIDKWQRWIDIIHNEIVAFSTDRYLYKEITTLFNNNPSLTDPRTFADFVVRGYATSAFMAIRRQIKIKNDSSVSLAKLLDDVSKNNEILSEDWFISNYSANNHSLGRNDFKQFSNGGSFVNKQFVLDDLKKLKDSSIKVEAFGDKRIAHYDKKEISSLPFMEFDQCADALLKLFEKYWLLFRAEAINLPPTYQFDWKKVFKALAP